jgi:hypothetical protein
MEMVTKVDPKNIKVDFEAKNERMKNFRDRIWFIKYWVEFMKINSDEEWSKGQAELIDSQFETSKEVYEDLERSVEGRKISNRLLGDGEFFEKVK